MSALLDPQTTKLIAEADDSVNEHETFTRYLITPETIRKVEKVTNGEELVATLGVLDVLAFHGYSGSFIISSSNAANIAP
jgi:hypothetical protein